VHAGDLEKVIGIKGQEDRFINDRKIATSFSGAGFVVDTVQSKLYPAWKTYAQESNTFNDDATKISSDSQQFAGSPISDEYCAITSSITIDQLNMRLKGHQVSLPLQSIYRHTRISQRHRHTSKTSQPSGRYNTSLRSSFKCP